MTDVYIAALLPTKPSSDDTIYQPLRSGRI